MNNSSKHLHYNALSHMGPSPAPGTCVDRAGSGLQVQGRVKAQSLLPAQPARLRKDGDTAGAAQGFQFFWGKDQGHTEAKAAPPCGTALQTMGSCACSFHSGLVTLPRRGREPVCEALWAPQPREASQLHDGSHRLYINKTQMNVLCAGKPWTLTLNFT